MTVWGLGRRIEVESCFRQAHARTRLYVASVVGFVGTTIYLNMRLLYKIPICACLLCSLLSRSMGEDVNAACPSLTST